MSERSDKAEMSEGEECSAKAEEQETIGRRSRHRSSLPAPTRGSRSASAVIRASTAFPVVVIQQTGEQRQKLVHADDDDALIGFQG